MLPVALVGGCVDLISEHTSNVGEITRDCVVPPPADAVALDAPVSLEYPGASLWIWDHVELTGGGTVANAAARVTSAGDTCDAGPILLRDAAGHPRSLLALSAAEQADNAARTDGKQLALVPSGGVVVDGVGYLYYDHVLRGPGLFDAVTLGTGLCVLRSDAAACERVADGSGATLLWTPDARVMNRGGLVIDEDGTRHAVIAGCRRVAELTTTCTIAGVPVASLEDPAAYRELSVFAGWVDQLTDASVFADEAGSVTLSAYDGGFLATSLDIFESRFYVRRSTRAVSNYEHRIAAFDAVPQTTLFVRGGREHAALRPDPRTIVVSYATSGAAAPGLHLVTYRFHGDFQ